MAGVLVFTVIVEAFPASSVTFQYTSKYEAEAGSNPRGKNRKLVDIPTSSPAGAAAAVEGGGEGDELDMEATASSLTPASLETVMVAV